MKQTPKNSAASTAVSLSGADATDAPASENPPSPPGGGRWRWTGSIWEDLDPKPAQVEADTTNQTATE